MKKLIFCCLLALKLGYGKIYASSKDGFRGDFCQSGKDNDVRSIAVSLSDKEIAEFSAIKYFLSRIIELDDNELNRYAYLLLRNGMQVIVDKYSKESYHIAWNRKKNIISRL